MVNAAAAIPIVGLVVIATKLIVYVMRVFAVSTHRAREFLFIAAYAAVFFPTGLFDQESLTRLFWEIRIGCFVLTMIFLQVTHKWTPMQSALTLPSISKVLRRHKR